MKLNKNITALLTAAAASVMIASPVMAYEAGDIVVRGRILQVAPQDDSGSLRSPAGSVANSGASVDSDIIPELDFTYMIAPNWGVELILGFSDHDVKAKAGGSSLGEVADVKVLPPTLTLQYHFMPTSNIRPYAGVGVNYTHYFDTKAKGALDGQGLEIDDSFGLSLQAGVDVDINEDWFVNFDVKYIDMDADAEFKSAAGVKTKVDIDVDPIVWGIGVGTTF